MGNPLTITSTLSASLQKADSSKSADTKISKASHDFEALLLTNWLQSAEQSFAAVPGQDEDQDPGKEQYQSFAMQSLGASLTKAGGIGLASSIARQLQEAAGSEAPSGTGPSPRSSVPTDFHNIPML